MALAGRTVQRFGNRPGLSVAVFSISLYSDLIPVARPSRELSALVDMGGRRPQAEPALLSREIAAC